MRGAGYLVLVSLIKHIPNFFRLFWRLFWDGRVGMLPRLLIVAALAYLVWPADLDLYLPFKLGYIDDMIVIYLALRAFVALCPKGVVAEHVARIEAGR